MDFKNIAKELVDKFMDYAYDSHTGYPDDDVRLRNAKQCALICVDEMIKSCKETVKLYEGNGYIDSDISPQPEDYWQEVRKEIKKL